MKKYTLQSHVWSMDPEGGGEPEFEYIGPWVKGVDAEKQLEKAEQILMTYFMTDGAVDILEDTKHYFKERLKGGK